jgi:hypothetical protein
MNAARPVEGLLPAGQTLRLLELVAGNTSNRNAEQIIRDLLTITPGSWSKARNTIQVLADFGLIKLHDGAALLHIAGPSTNWSQQIAAKVADAVAHQLAATNLTGCVRARAGNSALWIDSKLLPKSLFGLPLWIVEFGVAARDSTESRFWLIHEEHTPTFFRSVRAANRRPRRRIINADDLEADLAEMARRGAEAEDWVVDFERKRLAGHPLLDQVRRISNDDVGAGYDIVSFSDSSAIQHDLFIEVKSYTTQKRFFWSRNEIATAQEFGEDYSLYLVAYDRLADVGYAPQIIRGPYSALFLTTDPGWVISPSSFECVAI